MDLKPCLLGLLLAVSAQAETVVLNRRIEPGQTLARALYNTPLVHPQVEAIIGALHGVFDFKKSRAGDQFRLVLNDGELDFFDYRRSAIDEWQVRRTGDRFVAEKDAIEVERVVATVELVVESSLYDAAMLAGEDPIIAMTVADAFAWDIDFYQDVQKGDRAKLVVEKFLAKGRVLRYGDVLAATYEGLSVGNKRIFRYQLPTGEYSYFQQDGNSARKTFLKSPLKYASITSRFGSRMHPVLQYVKNHNGVDYGTPVGTPVWAVAHGTITKAGFDGAAGHRVCVRHVNSMETCYLHLSGYGEGIRVGTKVTQKQVIGFSGNTGMSTGPHLHFAMLRGGKFVNPLNQNFPRAEPVPPELLSHFSESISPWVSQLEGISVAGLPTTTGSRTP